jgi:glycosyltransferase involved in cell wall biosynthesis
MKVLQLNTFDETGGAAKAASRLHQGLKAIGIDSQMLVQFKVGDDKDVIGARTPVGRILRNIRPHLDALPVRLYPNRPVLNFSPALLPDTLLREVEIINPAIIHLHWVTAGFLRLETLRRFNRPLIWTLHDSWAFTGGCHVPFDCTRYRQQCGACPVLGSSRDHDLSRCVWRRKQKAWREILLTVVVPSRWLADCARESSLFHDRRIEVIPNGLDLKRYKPVDKRTARELLALPLEKKLILFGGMSGTIVRNKGFHLLVPALQDLARRGCHDRPELLVFGSSEPTNPPDLGLKTHYLGLLNDESRLALFYAAADVFVFPSIQETLGYTAMESMACGTPCVAFNQGGVPDLIDHERNGYLARPFEPDDLARGIAWVLEDEGRRQALSLRARRKVEEEFALERVAHRYAELYADVARKPTQ